MDDGYANNRHEIGASKREAAERAAATAHPDAYTGQSPIKVKKLGHLIYEVSDIERSIRFWTEVMGFTVTERNEIGMVFLRHGSDHHSIGLKPTKGPKQRPAASDGMRIEHLAFEVDNVETLLKARDYMKANNIPIVFEGRKGPGCNDSINFLDPDGYEFEVYCNMDQIDASGRLRPRSLFRPAPTLDEAVKNPVSKTW
jgi:catechol 2,3-dioxygenase-like lactoylglutathione lyase family enzyme